MGGRGGGDWSLTRSPRPLGVAQGVALSHMSFLSTLMGSMAFERAGRLMAKATFGGLQAEKRETQPPKDPCQPTAEKSAVQPCRADTRCFLCLDPGTSLMSLTPWGLALLGAGCGERGGGQRLCLHVRSERHSWARRGRKPREGGTRRSPEAGLTSYQRSWTRKQLLAV